MIFLQIVITIVIVNFYADCLTNLKHFETFSEISVTTRVKRFSGSAVLTKDVSFTMFGRDFHLSLKSGASVLTSDFQAYIVDPDGRKESYRVDQSRLYTGILQGKSSTYVNAYVVDDLWSINILDDNETFAVEPANLLLNESENPSNHLFVAYRISDFKQEFGECGFEVPVLSDYEGLKYNSTYRLTEHEGNSSRPRRHAKEQVCELCLVGDYSLYDGRCKKNHAICFSMLINFVEFADEVYTSSIFIDSQDGYLKLGVQVKLILLYSTATKKSSSFNVPHFNEPEMTWTPETFLDSVSFYMAMEKRQLCHTHIFTSYAMPEHVLGLSYLLGFCSKPTTKGLLSTAFSSSKDIIVGHVTSLQFNLVFIHGHNLGSYHDPVTEECAPEDSSGGKYVMWQRSVMGTQSNHKKFSPCSLKAIGRAAEDYNCLVERSSMESLCGNAVVEKGEQCDAGAEGTTGTDPCCSASCEFKPQAICSDINDGCCQNCQVAPNTSSCLVSVVNDCKIDSYCKYPFMESILPDWTPCYNDGACHDGNCFGYCEMKSLVMNLSLKVCLCQGDLHACQRCCYDDSNPQNPGPCVNHSESSMPDGMHCYRGFCQDGVCEVYQSKVRSIYSYIISLRTSELVKFMRTNIVLTVMILSIFIWVPSSYLIARWDRKWAEEEEDEDFRFRHAPSDQWEHSFSSDENSEECLDPVRKVSFSHKLRFAHFAEDVE
nr:ADAM 17-like protease isoform X1 [Biomphalaria glabrata]